VRLQEQQFSQNVVFADTHRPMDVLLARRWRLRLKLRRPLQRQLPKIAILGGDCFLSQNKLMLMKLKCSARKNNETIVPVPAETVLSGMRGYGSYA
jgi:hypothetical protein